MFKKKGKLLAEGKLNFLNQILISQELTCFNYAWSWKFQICGKGKKEEKEFLKRIFKIFCCNLQILI